MNTSNYSMVARLRLMATRTSTEAYEADSLSGVSKDTFATWGALLLLGLVSWPAMVYTAKATGAGAWLALAWLSVLLLSVPAMIMPGAYGNHTETDERARKYLFHRAIPNALASGMMASFFLSQLYHAFR